VHGRGSPEKRGAERFDSSPDFTIKFAAFLCTQHRTKS
jgi:hypothetical protein